MVEKRAIISDDKQSMISKNYVDYLLFFFIVGGLREGTGE